MRRAHVIAGIVVPWLTPSAAFAEAPASRWFPVPANALYLTGDSWSDTGVTYRLYGVQSCLRGTSFTNAHGLERDCGEASLAMLVALTRDLRPQCYDAAEQPETKTVFVFCVATRVAGAGAGSRIDLVSAELETHARDEWFRFCSIATIAPSSMFSICRMTSARASLQ